MPNYFKVKRNKEFGPVEMSGSTISGDGKEGPGNAAEQFVANTLKMPVEDVVEVTKEEYDAIGATNKTTKLLWANEDQIEFDISPGMFRASKVSIVRIYPYVVIDNNKYYLEK